MGNKYVKEKSSKKRINEDDTHSNKKGKNLLYSKINDCITYAHKVSK